MQAHASEASNSWPNAPLPLELTFQWLEMQSLILYLTQTGERGMAGLRSEESQFSTLPNQLVKTCWLLLKYDPER